MCLLSGCASINYELAINSNGTINERIYLPLNKEVFLTLGASEEQYANLQQDIKLRALQDCNALKAEWYSRVDNDSDITNKDIFKQNLDIQYLENSETFLIQFTFQNTLVRNHFYNIEEEEQTQNSKATVETKFFTVKTTTVTKTKFATLYSDNKTLVQHYTELFYALVNYRMPDVIQSLPEPTYTYTYVTGQKRLHSDAEEIQENNGYYYHSWTIEPEALDKEITLYTIYARREIWYALILGTTLIAIGIMFLVHFFKKIKIKQENV